MLEKDVDEKIVSFAKKKGCVVIKLTTLAGHGESGWPDRLFLRAGKVVFMEMKRTGGVSTENQILHQLRLAIHDFIVYKDVDSPEQGKEIIEREFPGVDVREVTPEMLKAVCV